MINRGEWITPYLYDKPQFEKPILFYWLVELSYRIFGVNEFAARFPSSVFGLIGVVCIYFFGSLLFNRRVGVLSAAILATNVEYVVLSRSCITDMVLFALMLFSAYFFFQGYIKGKNIFYVLSSISLALATLTKGPVAIVLFTSIMLIYLFSSRDLKFLRQVPILLLYAAVFVVVTAPWYIAIYKIHGKNFVEVFLGFHNVTRFLESEHKIGSQFYYNIPIVLGGFFPWSAFLPFGLWYAFKIISSKGKDEKNRIIFLLIWFFVIFAFFSISSTKLPTYIFPSFISLALIVALTWDHFLRQDPLLSIEKMTWSYYLLVMAIIAGSIGALVYVRLDYPSILKGVLVLCLFLGFGMLLSFIAFVRKKFLWAFALIVYSVTLIIFPVCELVLPVVEYFETSKCISEKLLMLMRYGQRLGSESNYLAGLAFYTGKMPVDVDKHHNLVQFLGSQERVWCVLKEKNHRELYELDTKPYYTRPSYMLYKIGKRSIVTNLIPDDGRYLIMRERKR